MSTEFNIDELDSLLESQEDKQKTTDSATMDTTQLRGIADTTKDPEHYNLTDKHTPEEVKKAIDRELDRQDDVLDKADEEFFTKEFFPESTSTQANHEQKEASDDMPYELESDETITLPPIPAEELVAPPPTPIEPEISAPTLEIANLPPEQTSISKPSQSEFVTEKTVDADQELEKQTSEEQAPTKSVTDEVEHEKQTPAQVQDKASQHEQETEQLTNPKLPRIQIEYKKRTPEDKKSEKGLSAAEVEKKKNDILLDISRQVEEVEKSMDWKIDYDNVNLPKYRYYVFRQLLIDKTIAPGKLSLEAIIPSITDFKTFKSFDTPPLSLMHTIPQKIIALKKMNEIYQYEFIDTSKYNRNFHLNDLTETIEKFLITQKPLQTTKLEYELVMNFMQKLILSLCCFEELSFLSDSIQVTGPFKRIVYKDFSILNTLDPKCRMYVSWDSFRKAIMDTSNNAMIFKFKDYRDLSIKFMRAFDPESHNAYLLEQLLGATLKTCVPSITLTYLYAVRSMYVLARLIGIYIQNKCYYTLAEVPATTNTKKSTITKRRTAQLKPLNTIIEDLYFISISAIALYENEWSLITQCTRSFPTIKGVDVKPETKEHINSHLLTSGVYYLLKMLERSVLCIAHDLAGTQK